MLFVDECLDVGVTFTLSQRSSYSLGPYLRSVVNELGYVTLRALCHSKYFGCRGAKFVPIRTNQRELLMSDL